jgi:hypothetical protein
MDKTIKQVIARTKLLSDAEKIALLVAYDELADADKEHIAQILRDYDAQYARAVAGLRASIDEALPDVKAEGNDEAARAIHTIRRGLSILTS